MGDIAFNIFKDVDLNKVVNLDIDKNVDVNVNNPDILATAEADAEAFGPNALAEVDAYTYVNFEDGVPPIFSSGQLQVEGGTLPFAGTPPGDDIFIDFNQDVSPGITGELPDVDDVNAIDHFADLDGVPAPPADTGLPQPLLTITDLLLTPVNNTIEPPGTPPDVDLWEYTNNAPFEVDFGIRNVERNSVTGFQPGETGNLILTVPADESWEVLFNTSTGAVEVNLEVDNAFFTFTPMGDLDDCPLNNEPFVASADFDFIADSLGQLAGYEFQALTDEIIWYGCEGQGEAFAYAESTAGLDLL
ncbi:MAG: hypothetical protein QNJ32_14350 [Xenococcaceae cyanobacterium MO_167.B27]|nr:hypothetical protein [Xenococcaceae cyanobacterium MO_167.B27]